MILVRVIPLKNLAQTQINNLSQFGFTLVERGNDLQIWVERADYRE